MIGADKISVKSVASASSAFYSVSNQIMFTFHPQRWSDDFFIWSKELIIQNLKNVVKRFLVK